MLSFKCRSGTEIYHAQTNVKIDVMQTFFKPLACTLAMTVTLLLFFGFRVGLCQHDFGHGDSHSCGRHSIRRDDCAA